VAAKYLERRGSGHIVGITSVAGLRGIGAAPAYSASKAFMSTYLQALRYRFRKMKLPVAVTDVRPGFVDTAMGKSTQRFWVASPEIAAHQIVAAIRRRRRHVYVTRRWRLAGWMMRMLPDAIYSRL
jgi:short-subunit dehydrogenase